MKFHFNGIQFELEEFSQLVFGKNRTSLRRSKIHGWELWGINRIRKRPGSFDQWANWLPNSSQ